MSFNSDNTLYASWALFGSVAVICFTILLTRGCQVENEKEVELERLHFSGEYEQQMVVTSQKPIWVRVKSIKDSCDTIAKESNKSCLK